MKEPYSPAIVQAGMKSILVLSVCLAAPLSFAQAINMTGSGGYGVESQYNRFYNNRRLVQIKGTITGKVKGTPLEGMAESATILVRDANRHVYSVDLGPSWYLQNQIVKLNLGDKVRVTGSPAKIGRESLILAKSVSRGKNVLALRDRAGFPYWDPRRNGTYTSIVKNYSPIQGKIVEVNTVDYNSEPYVSYVLDTANGRASVLVAPQWYYQRQDKPYQIGQGLTIYGQSVQIGNNGFTQANAVVGYNGFWRLRDDNGRPLWGN